MDSQLRYYSGPLRCEVVEETAIEEGTLIKVYRKYQCHLCSNYVQRKQRDVKGKRESIRKHLVNSHQKGGFTNRLLRESKSGAPGRFAYVESKEEADEVHYMCPLCPAHSRDKASYSQHLYEFHEMKDGYTPKSKKATTSRATASSSTTAAEPIASSSTEPIASPTDPIASSPNPIASSTKPIAHYILWIHRHRHRRKQIAQSIK